METARTRPRPFALVLSLALVACGGSAASAPAPAAAPAADVRAPDPAVEATDPARFAELVRDAYVYAYPYVLVDVTRELTTAVAAPGGDRAPTNQFAPPRDEDDDPDDDPFDDGD